VVVGAVGLVFLMMLRRMQLEVTAHGFRSSFRDWASECTSFPREVCAVLADPRATRTARPRRFLLCGNFGIVNPDFGFKGLISEYLAFE
jgi:hypothetical protein